MQVQGLNRYGVWCFKFALLLLSLIVLVPFAQAECELSDNDQRALAELGDKLSAGIDGAVIHLTKIYAQGDSKSLSAIQRGFDTVSPISSGQIRPHLAASVEEIVALYPDEQGAKILVIVDSEFMFGEKPKYNDLLSQYKDTEIAPKTTMIVDVGQANAAHPRRVVQINGKLADQEAALMMELGVIMAVAPAAMSISSFRDYAILLSKDAIGDGAISPETSDIRARLFACTF